MCCQKLYSSRDGNGIFMAAKIQNFSLSSRRRHFETIQFPRVWFGGDTREICRHRWRKRLIGIYKSAFALNGLAEVKMFEQIADSLKTIPICNSYFVCETAFAA